VSAIALKLMRGRNLFQTQRGLYVEYEALHNTTAETKHAPVSLHCLCALPYLRLEGPRVWLFRELVKRLLIDVRDARAVLGGRSVCSVVLLVSMHCTALHYKDDT
jgi:hypothetical protein